MNPNKAVAQVLTGLQAKLCDGAMLEQIDWAISVLAEEAARLRVTVKPDYQPRVK